MSEELLNKILTSEFGKNKYYIEIIKSFIENYPKDTTRININSRDIHIKANDIAGSRDIYFDLNSYNNLKIKVDRNVDLYKYQNIIIYDEKGVMIERSIAVAKIKDNINQEFDNKDILVEEFSEIGKNASIYTGKIFDMIDYKYIKRAENYSLDGFYSHKNVTYDEKGVRSGKLIEGFFNVLESSSISSLDFPSDDNIKITNTKNLNDDNIYMYPNSRSL